MSKEIGWKTTVCIKFILDGDGIGDLQGIRSKLTYLEYMKDFGYDITNFTEIDPVFGTMHDFHRFAVDMKDKGLKIIMDFVPNHTSNTSVWFEKSVKKEDPYTDYYIWVDGIGPKKDKVPNNWLGKFGGPAWQWVPERKQFYYHQFIPEEPDLNYRNCDVREEMRNVLRFWLDRGVDGFRINALKYLFEDKKLRDESPSKDVAAKPGEYKSLDHQYTTGDPKIQQVLQDWRDVLNEFELKDGYHRILMTEIDDNVREIEPLIDVQLNFDLLNIVTKSTAKDVYGFLKRWLNKEPKSKILNWMLGNHDQPRIPTRTNENLIDAYNMINILLEGLPLTYFGEEIGMVDTFIPWEQSLDPFGLFYGPERYCDFSRDPQRTPMQWNKKAMAGFTESNKPWLPLNENYKLINVESEKLDIRSHLSTYRRLQKMKNSTVGRYGEVQFPLVTDSILCFSRTNKDSHLGIVVVINFGDKDEHVDLTQDAATTDGFEFSIKGLIGAVSDGISDESPLVKLDTLVSLANIFLGPKQAVAFWFEPKFYQSKQREKNCTKTD